MEVILVVKKEGVLELYLVDRVEEKVVEDLMEV